MEKTKRPSWDEYFMEMAELTAKRSTCMRRNVGAVIVKDKRAIATGYNGAPKGIRHCEDRGGCLRQKLGVPSGQRHELCMALHAEQNAIIQAASMGHAIEGGTMTEFERECDNAVNRYMTGAHLKSFGPEQVVGYLTAEEGNTMAVRMVLTGLLAGIDPERLKERLRESYV